MLRSGDLVPALELRPAFGRALSLPDDLEDGPLVVVWLGGVSTPDTRAAVATLQEASAELDRAGVRLIAISTSALARVQDFVSRFHVLFPVVSDANTRLREQFGVGPGAPSDLARGLARDVRRLSRGGPWGRGWVEPGAYAPAACLVLSEKGEVVWSAEGIPFEAMVEAARLSRSE